MPYASNADLPPAARSHPPAHAQDIYRAAFNNAYESHAAPRREEAARRIACAAAKRSYVKVSDDWVAR